MSELDSVRVREALDYYDRTYHLPMPAVDPLAGAAREWLEGTEIRWCAVHAAKVLMPTWTLDGDIEECPLSLVLRAEGKEPSCRVVSRRLVGSEDTE
jgi:hypothetical protein